MAKSYPPPLNEETAIKIIGNFLDEELSKTSKKKLIVGLSGGVDSALSAVLAVSRLGKEKVLAVKMPYRCSNPQSEKDADLLIKKFSLKSERIDISPIADAYFGKKGVDDPKFRIRRGNFLARIRMAILFDISQREDGLVLGTSNKTEMLLGYTTWYGDSASSLNPIGDLYKSQVYQLANYLGIPSKIINKPPSADLWKNQTDEKEMGIAYKDADAILYLVVDERYTLEEAAKILNLPIENVKKVFKRVETTQFKRRLQVVAKMSLRTVGIDFRYPRDWGK